MSAKTPLVYYISTAYPPEDRYGSYFIIRKGDNKKMGEYTNYTEAYKAREELYAQEQD